MKYDENMYICTLIHLFISCKQYSMPTELKCKTRFIGELHITVAQLQNSIFQAYCMIIDRLREQLSLCVVVWNSVFCIDHSRPNKARPPTNHTTPEGPVQPCTALYVLV